MQSSKTKKSREEPADRDVTRSEKDKPSRRDSVRSAFIARFHHSYLPTTFFISWIAPGRCWNHLAPPKNGGPDVRQELAKVTGPTECGQVVLGHFEFPELENLIPNLATSATLVIAVLQISPVLAFVLCGRPGVSATGQWRGWFSSFGLNSARHSAIVRACLFLKSLRYCAPAPILPILVRGSVSPWLADPATRRVSL